MCLQRVNEPACQRETSKQSCRLKRAAHALETVQLQAGTLQVPLQSVPGHLSNTVSTSPPHDRTTGTVP